jgi:glucosamine--fructose-6-phosphate aminotransferase (isomerizing)
MCGIFAAINGSSVTHSEIEGLRALAYRGYDSAGIAIIGANGLERRRASGKIDNLVAHLGDNPLAGPIGIGHTRWATHGKPTEDNAHPHMTDRVAVVHNGIIENYAELRTEMEEQGFAFSSETDSEVIPVLLTHYMNAGQMPAEAMRTVSGRLQGAFAVVAIFNDDPDHLYAARQNSPLVVGASVNGGYLSSDANAFGNQVQRICHMQNGDVAMISRTDVKIFDHLGSVADRQWTDYDHLSESVGKEGYRHFMLKEMHEQPAVIEKTLDYYLDSQGEQLALPTLPFDPANVRRLSIVACGTSYYAGTVAKHMIEEMIGIAVDVDIASEFHTRGVELDPQQPVLFISQSGETADTLAALRHAKAQGAKTLAIVNVANSTMGVESDCMLPTLAGPEIGVASTKAFTAQLTTLISLALFIARAKGRMNDDEVKTAIKAIRDVTPSFSKLLEDQNEIISISQHIQHVDHILYVGRGTAYPMAMEGALKLKEISYIHAEAYAAGELKHGPIALLDDDLQVVMVAPPGPLFEKTLSNLREIASRGAKITLISDEAGVKKANAFIANAITMPSCEDIAIPLLYALPLQLLAYHVAVMKGTDVDQPRNLAKSVTVE